MGGNWNQQRFLGKISFSIQQVILAKKKFALYESTMTIVRVAPKISLLFFGNNFYKNRVIFKIFSPPLLEVYRILLVEPTLELKMF